MVVCAWPSFGKNISVCTALVREREKEGGEEEIKKNPTNRLSDCEISLIKRIYCTFITLCLCVCVCVCGPIHMFFFHSLHFTLLLALNSDINAYCIALILSFWQCVLFFFAILWHFPLSNLFESKPMNINNRANSINFHSSINHEVTKSNYLLLLFSSFFIFECGIIQVLLLNAVECDSFVI